MGMDVIGKNPTCESGEYFRATIWSWPVDHRLMATTCRDLLSEDLLRAMEYNDGAGPDDQAICSQTADRLEAELEPADDCLVAETCSIELNPSTVGAQPSMGDNLATSQNYAYTMRNALLTEWIEFLRHCGGFAVW